MIKATILPSTTVLFKLTPEEVLAGTTIFASQALGLQGSKDQLAVGFDADLALWDIERPVDLNYLIGFNPLCELIGLVLKFGYYGSQSNFSSLVTVSNVQFFI